MKNPQVLLFITHIQTQDFVAKCLQSMHILHLSVHSLDQLPNAIDLIITDDENKLSALQKTSGNIIFLSHHQPWFFRQPIPAYVQLVNLPIKSLKLQQTITATLQSDEAHVAAQSNYPMAEIDQKFLRLFEQIDRLNNIAHSPTIKLDDYKYCFSTAKPEFHISNH